MYFRDARLYVFARKPWRGFNKITREPVRRMANGNPRKNEEMNIRRTDTTFVPKRHVIPGETRNMLQFSRTPVIKNIINFTTIKNIDLKNHIIRVGKIIFKKQ